MSAVSPAARGAIAAVAAVFIASGTAMAGGMPSDEGPEVMLDDVESPDGRSITEIIEAELPEYVEASSAGDDPVDSTARFTLPPAFPCPPCGWGHDS